MQLSQLYIGWLRLLRVYVFSVSGSFCVGLILLHFFHVRPETIFHASSTRISYVVPIFDAGMGLGLDLGVILFLWNSMGALITMLFFYAYSLFDLGRSERFPRFLRTMFLGRHQMKMLCYLPGCRKIVKENLRRLYVWLMIPLLGMILLGLESGMMLAVGNENMGSYLGSFLAFLPHGIIEIPAVALAGSVTYSAHLKVKGEVQILTQEQLFANLAAYENTLPVTRLICIVVGCLFVAGMVEAHLTPVIVSLF